LSQLYLETSALLTWMLGQARAAEVREAVDKAELVVTSALTFIETERALIRAERGHLMTAGDAQRLRGLARRARDSWMRMAVSEEVLSRAAMPFLFGPVRTLDAIHLATALVLTQALPDLRILTFDERIRANAVAVGLA